MVDRTQSTHRQWQVRLRVRTWRRWRRTVRLPARRQAKGSAIWQAVVGPNRLLTLHRSPQRPQHPQHLDRRPAVAVTVTVVVTAAVRAAVTRRVPHGSIVATPNVFIELFDEDWVSD